MALACEQGVVGGGLHDGGTLNLQGALQSANVRKRLSRGWSSGRSCADVGVFAGGANS